jgi:hypothetical protein
MSHHSSNAFLSGCRILSLEKPSKTIISVVLYFYLVMDGASAAAIIGGIGFKAVSKARAAAAAAAIGQVNIIKLISYDYGNL